jgi:hypothetical protein
MVIIVATMYVDTSTTKIKGRTYKRHLLRESYREAGRVKHRTVANLSRCSPEEVEAIRLALRYKDELPRLIESKPGLAVREAGGHRETAVPETGG